MSLTTRSNIFTEVLVRNNRTTADGFITDAMLLGWYLDANIWATSFKKWPFTEGRVETTFTTGAGVNGDEWEFEGYKADSFRIITVGGKRLKKLNFDDYLIQQEETPDSTERVYTDYGKLLYVNPNADISGTLVAYGQYQPAVDATDEDYESVFTNWDREGNEAIVEKMTVYLKHREHLLDEANAHDQIAMQKLNEVWQRIQDEKFNYKTSPERDGIFERIDVIDGGFIDNNTDQF